jgi:hypothetical protein
MQKSHRPLHILLDRLSCQTICNLLQQLQGILLRMSTDMSPNENKASRNELKRLVTCLYLLLPKADNEASSQLFQTTLVKTDDIEELASTEEACRRSNHPDQERVAAMKRLQILMEDSESLKTEEEKLSIGKGRMVLSKNVKKHSQISTRTLTATGDHDAGAPVQILVEWKAYEGFWDTEIGNALFKEQGCLLSSSKLPLSIPISEFWNAWVTTTTTKTIKGWAWYLGRLPQHTATLSNT